MAGESWGARTRRVLMTGVSYMIPFVAAGGLLIALGFLFGGYEIVGPFERHRCPRTRSSNLPEPAADSVSTHALFDSGFFAYLGAIFFIIGKTAFAFFIPALAGYIAFAIADRPGIAPGFVMGGLAADRRCSFGTPQTGFLGAIVGGVLAGVIAHWIASWQGADLGPRPDAGAGHPAAHHDHRRLPDDRGPRQADRLADGPSSTDGLNNMSGSQRDPARRDPRPDDGLRHGRPAEQGRLQLRRRRRRRRGGLAADAPQLKIMAAVMLAGMVPPIALALATVLRPELFTLAERENGKAAWLLGASFITEGAIPFAAADPLRVIPSHHARQRGDRRALDGLRRQRPGPARRHLRALRRGQHPGLPDRPGGRCRRRRRRA